MNRSLRQLTGFCCLFMTFFAFSFSPAWAADGAKRVLVLPLTINAEKEMPFLDKGILDMMVSRIGQTATVVRQADPKTGKTPIQQARDLKADYVVTGSATLYGNSASTDAALIRVDTGEAALQFSQFGQNSGDVLLHVNQFATQVSQYMTSLAAPGTPGAATAPLTVAPVVKPPIAPAPASQPVVAAPTPAPVQTPAVAQVMEKTPQSAALWTSSPFKGVISALATADVDGNGRSDIVFAHEKEIVVETRNGSRLDRLAAFDAGSRHTIVSVDAGDINGNRVAEIFVTRLDANNKLDSIVLEWNGATLAPIATGQAWYFRVANDPEKGFILMGQRRGTPTKSDTGTLFTTTHFLPGIFELIDNGNGYEPGRRFPLPSDQNVYRIARGDVFNDGKIRTIAYSADDTLRVYNPSGNPQWAGQETLGGNPLFLQSVSTTDVRTKDRFYLTQRLAPVDLDGDGTVEVVTVYNRDAARGVVERFRKYTRGRIVVLRWNKLNMKEVWTGEEIGGYISDFSVADIDGDGRLETVYAMVTSSGLLQVNASSIVVEPFGKMQAD